MELLQYISIKDIWAWLIFKGYKKIENRNYKLKEARLHVATALQVSSTPYENAHQYYKLPEVAKYLKEDEETKDKSYSELDAYFKTYYHGNVIGVVHFEASYRSDTIPDSYKDFDFFNIPKNYGHNWIISGIIPFEIKTKNPIKFPGQVNVCDFDLSPKNKYCKLHQKTVSQIIDQLQKKGINHIINSDLNSIKSMAKFILEFDIDAKSVFSGIDNNMIEDALEYHSHLQYEFDGHCKRNSSETTEFMVNTFSILKDKSKLASMFKKWHGRNIEQNWKKKRTNNKVLIGHRLRKEKVNLLEIVILILI